MAEESILIGISQLGAVFIGFISIFMVFARQDGRFSPADGLRVRSIFYASFSVILGALVPLVLFSFAISMEILWRITAALHSAFGSLILIEAARFQMAMTKSERREAGRIQNVISWGVLLSVALILFLMVFGFGGAATYILVLVLILAVATTSFLSFAFQRLL